MEVKEIVNAAEMIISDMSRRTIIDTCKEMDAPFEIIYDIVNSYNILGANEEDKKHIAWFIVGYCGMN